FRANAPASLLATPTEVSVINVPSFYHVLLIFKMEHIATKKFTRTHTCLDMINVTSEARKNLYMICLW
ncbi:hypothetical protein ACJX0J_028900, partial [Zea mays]